MLFINYFKGQPNEYIIKFGKGKIRKEGHGISFFYMKSRSSVVSIPTTTVDANFIFNEMTQTFQAVTIQGQLTYRIGDVKKIFALLDFSINPRTGEYLSEDPGKLAQRIINAVQMLTRAGVQELSLEEALNRSESIALTVLDKIRGDEKINSMGVSVESIYFTSVTPIPEIGKALEAEYRELLQKKADEAIYSRRAAAVEQERIIKQNELNSEIDLEKRRQELVELNGANKIREAEFKSKAMELEWGPYKNLEPKLLVALGLKALGESGANINNLNLNPDLISLLLEESFKKKGDS
ncbi:MAG TPA: SPFH domain-containing protein [Spirochaetota bacterium]|nr:SPFH domain-containing protein [Spirochaetota bacterium]